jgi:hypothetical protein
MLSRRLRCFCANGHAKIKNEFCGLTPNNEEAASVGDLHMRVAALVYASLFLMIA